MENPVVVNDFSNNTSHERRMQIYQYTRNFEPNWPGTKIKIWCYDEIPYSENEDNKRKMTVQHFSDVSCSDMVLESNGLTRRSSVSSTLSAVRRERDVLRGDVVQLDQERTAANQARQVLADRVENLVDQTKCGVCFDHPLSIALNCGHLVCSACAPQLNDCPQCRETITLRLRVYLPQ